MHSSATERTLPRRALSALKVAQRRAQALHSCLPQPELKPGAISNPNTDLLRTTSNLYINGAFRAPNLSSLSLQEHFGLYVC